MKVRTRVELTHFFAEFFCSLLLSANVSRKITCRTCCTKQLLILESVWIPSLTLSFILCYTQFEYALRLLLSNNKKISTALVPKEYIPFLPLRTITHLCILDTLRTSEFDHLQHAKNLQNLYCCLRNSTIVSMSEVMHSSLHTLHIDPPVILGIIKNHIVLDSVSCLKVGLWDWRFTHEYLTLTFDVLLDMFPQLKCLFCPYKLLESAFDGVKSISQIDELHIGGSCIDSSVIVAICRTLIKLNLLCIRTVGDYFESFAFMRLDLYKDIAGVAPSMMSYRTQAHCSAGDCVTLCNCNFARFIFHSPYPASTPLSGKCVPHYKDLWIMVMYRCVTLKKSTQLEREQRGAERERDRERKRVRKGR